MNEPCMKTNVCLGIIKEDVNTPSHYMVNELQTTFGVPAEDGLPVTEARSGRFVYDDTLQAWRFEEGLFCQNQLCNLRVEVLLEQLGVAATNQTSVTEGDRLDEV